MTLTIQDLGPLGELLGSVAVLATLVYVALQTRQNTMAIGAQLEAAALGAVQNWFQSVATSNELQEALAEDRVDDRTISHATRTVVGRAVPQPPKTYRGSLSILGLQPRKASVPWIPRRSAAVSRVQHLSERLPY